jgi:hypothetical protein
MITFFSISILVLFLIAYWRKMHNTFAEKKFKAELYQLRDELRFLAIQGKVDSKSVIFDYLDYTFSKTIKNSYQYTLFYIISLNFVHQKDKNTIELSEKLFKKINENPNLESITIRFLNIVRTYVRDQHFTTFVFLKFVLTPIMGVQTLMQKYKDINESALFLPETSASGRYIIGN